MAKLIARYRLGGKLLKIYETSKGLKGKLYQFVWDTSVSPNRHTLELVESKDFLAVDRENTQGRVKGYFQMNFAKPVTSDSLIDVNHRIIWNNNNYDEWKACMEEDYPDGTDEEDEEVDFSYERYMEDCDQYLSDERANLDVEVQGVIVCFADLGLWDGRHNGAKVFGTNVKSILYSKDDYLDWYCDRYNVRCEGVHHDGTNSYLYRVAKSREQAENLVHAIAYEDMTEEQFMKATKSLRPYVAKVYGF